MSQSVNTFTELNSDSHPLNTKPNVMTDAVNATLTTRGENQLIVQNLKGTDLITQLTPGFKPLAVEVYKNIAYIVSAKFDNNGNFIQGEIGTFPSPDYSLISDPNVFYPLIEEYRPLQNFLPDNQLPIDPLTGLTISGLTLDTFLNQDSNYVHDFRTSKFNFRNDSLIEMELQPSYDGSVNILLTDDRNPVRLINSRFIVGEDSKTASLANRRQNKDTNTYSEQRFLATKLLRTSSIIPDLQFLGVKPGGNLPGGGYKVYFKYIDSDGSLSEIIEESRLVSVAYDDHGAKPTENTGKYIEFSITNLDYKFSGIKVYFAYIAGTIEPVTMLKEILEPFDLDDTGTVSICIYGNETTTDISADQLNLNYSSLDHVKSFAQKDDRLVLANITSNSDDLEKFRKLAQLFTINEDVKDLTIIGTDKGYADPNHVYFDLGYWSYETYELGVCFELTNGRGVTPAFPLRGLDNSGMNGQGTGYTIDTSNINFSADDITSSDGFVANNGRGENRLGVYRTTRGRTMLKGTDNDTTEVRYLKIDVSALFTREMNPSIVNPYQSIIDNDIAGFFIVRKERKKDCVVQGYFTNTARVNINPISNEISPFYYNIGSSLTLLNDARALTNLRESYGKTGTIDEILKNTKIIPAPGRILEHTIEDRCYKTASVNSNGGTSAYNAIPNIKNLTFQGRVNPEPSIATFNGKDVEANYAMYSNDMLANPAFFASLFNNSKKSIVVNDVSNSAIKMREILNSASSYINNNGATSLYPYIFTGTGTTSLQNTLAAPPNPGSVYLAFRGTGSDIYLTEQPPSVGQPNGILTGSLKFKYYDNTLNPDWGGLGFSQAAAPWNFDLNITVDELGVITASMPTAVTFYNPSSSNTNPRYELSHDSGSGPITGTWVHMHPTASTFILSSSYTLTIPLKIEKWLLNVFTNQYYLDSSDTKLLTFTGTYDDLIYTNGSTNGITVFSPDVLNTPIKVLKLDNFNFNPTDRYYSITGQYISELLDGYSDGNFSAISSRNHYLYTTQKYNGNSPANEVAEVFSGATGTGWRFLASDARRYGDYVGIRMKRGVNDLIYPLANDPYATSNYVNFPTNDLNISGTDNGDWTYRVQHEGIRFAVLANIYDSADGPMPISNWKNKYSNLSFAETYFAVTKRFTLQEIKNRFLDPVAPTPFVDVFGGDCYINYSYKRASYGAGIDGVPTATDPSLYREGELSAGLYPKGFVFPLVMESNYNTSLRTFEFKDLVESGIYGKERTFYPIDNIDSLRSSRQLESKGVNQGYNYDNSEVTKVALNDRAPVLNINYDTRVLVSEPSVSGSFTNGYTNFSGLNFRDYTKHLGSITKVIAHNNYLFCIQERGIGVVPMNQRTMVSEQQGGVFLDNAQLLDSKLQMISTEYGSTQQFSIIKTDQSIYGCDLNKNKIWKIVSQGGQHGLEIISDFAVQSVLNEFKKNIDSASTKNFVKANYDRSANNVIFTYYNLNEGDFTVIDTFEVVINQDGEQLQVRKPVISGLYYNETLGKWVSRISWNPLFMFEIANNIYSFSNEDGSIWNHYSENVPYCYIYGKQHKFELEFILVDNSSAQKMLDNLLIISNRSFPGRIKYTIDKDVDYENFSVKDNSYLELMRQRHEDINSSIIVQTNYLNGQMYFNLDLSIEELQRLEGAYFVWNNTVYILGGIYIDNNNNTNYIEILDQNANIVTANIPNITFDKLQFGIIKQNMEYIEDHLYVEVGKATDSSLIRDKAIRIKLTYEGMNYTVIQSIISLFQYSFS